MQLHARHGNGERRATGRPTGGWAFLLTLAAALGCSNNPNTITLEVYTWWSHTSERAAFNEVLSLHRQRHENVEIADPSSRDTRTRRSQRMLAGAPPDTFQTNVGADLLRWALVDLQFEFDEDVATPFDRTENLLTELTELYNDELLGKVPDDVDSMLRLGPGTPPFAIPMNIHRLNVLYYNKDKFDAYEDPEGRDLFHIDTLCPETPGKAPLRATIALATLTDNWTLLHFVFENLLAALAERERKRNPEFDPDFYQHLFEGSGPGERLSGGESLLVKKALECARYLSRTSTRTDRWWEAADAVALGSATFTVMGDWGNAALATQLEQGTVVAIPFPGTEDLYVYTSDTFPLPLKVEYPNEAFELLRTFASRDAQEAFSRRKGSIPARFDTDFVSPPGWSTEDDFRDPKKRKLLATSGYFQRYYPEAELAGELAFMLSDSATDAAIDAPLRRFTDAEKLLARWHTRRQDGARATPTTTTEP